jgi:hypothetical protein
MWDLGTIVRNNNKALEKTSAREQEKEPKEKPRTGQHVVPVPDQPDTKRRPAGWP